MEFRLSLASIILNLLQALVTIYGSPMSPSSSSQYSLSVRSESSLCETVELKVCKRIYAFARMPNLYGDVSQPHAGKKLHDILKSIPNSDTTSAVLTFFCTLYIPPCSKDDQPRSSSSVTSLPCRTMCEIAEEEAGTKSWPLSCHTFPTENCYKYKGPYKIEFVKRSLEATPTRPSFDDVISFAPLDMELSNDDTYEVEVVSLSSNHIPPRRYDIADLGDPNFFQGWADVQGTGAANDYCRVIGKGKRRFLSCNLAGSTGQGHDYVSKLGFDAGIPGTWFMRDMDGDKRDDYCRCVGKKNKSKLQCMKAGEKSFYGSTVQGGNQNTFALPNSYGCHNKTINRMFGE